MKITFIISSSDLSKKVPDIYTKLYFKVYFFYFCWFFVVVGVNQMNCFSLFPHLIYLPGYILDKKEMGAIFEQKGEKQYTGTKMEAFQLFLRINSAIMACNYRVYTKYEIFLAYIFIADLFIRHYIFQDHVGRNV